MFEIFTFKWRAALWLLVYLFLMTYWISPVFAPNLIEKSQIRNSSEVTLAITEGYNPVAGWVVQTIPHVRVLYNPMIVVVVDVSADFSNRGQLSNVSLKRLAPALRVSNFILYTAIWFVGGLILEGIKRYFKSRVQNAVERRTFEHERTSASESAIDLSEPKATGAVKRWDIFISHASEDKEEIAHALAEALQKRGFAVWYDKFSLKLGDSLRESIDQGLAESRFGVVILSKHFFAKRWPNKELNGLTAIEINGEKLILPVWHRITHDEVLKFSPTLADRKAVRTEKGLDAVVEAIAAVVDPPLAEDLREQLQTAEETLQEYRCPFCEAPLSARSSVDLSEDDSGLYENFECGYAHIDGYMEHPCPSDPKFPKLTDYKFIDEEVEGDSHWKWQCVAIGNTKEAQKLMLLPGLGRTKEEARARVEESYRNYAKPWKR